MTTPYSLKDLFDVKLVEKMSADLTEVWEGFDEHGFTQRVMSSLPALELKQRAELIAECLHEFLPKSYPEALDILIKSLGTEDTERHLKGVSNFYYMPASHFVARWGLNDFDISMQALYEITKRFTSEFSIRPFIEKYPQKTLLLLHEWVKDPNPHVRRLVSEGTRPRLPWASRLTAFQKDPAPVIELLEQLKTDNSLYVRRSVANNLNDIAKDHPERVIDLLRSWSSVDFEGTQWIIRHASRTMVKEGRKDILDLLGYPAHPNLTISPISVAKEAKIGEKLPFQFTVQSHEKQAVALMVDYVVHYNKANGEQKPKVFKLAKKTIEPGEVLAFSRKISLTQKTTRTHYPGPHFVEIQINGTPFGKTRFELK